MGLLDWTFGGDQPATADGGLSDQTLAFLKQQEGYAPRASWDYKQWSGGYGSRAAPGEVFTPESAQAALVRDAAPVSQWLDSNVKGQLTPGQRTALTSFGYNLGTGSGGLQDLLPDINNGDWARVAARMQHYNHAGGDVSDGLTNRRAQEAALLMNGGPSMASPDDNNSDAIATMMGVPGGFMPPKRPSVSVLPPPAAAAPAANMPALQTPDQRYQNLAQAFMNEGINMPVRGYGDAVRGLSSTLLGALYGDKFQKQQNAYNAAVGQRIGQGAGMQDPQAAMKALAGIPDYQPQVAQSVLQREGMKLVTVQDPNNIMGATLSKMQDPLTGKLYELDGKTPFNPGAGGGIPGAAGAPGGAAAIPAGVHGDELLQAGSFNPSQAALIKGIASYSLPIEQFRRMQTNPQLMAMVERYDPSFSAMNYATVQGANKKMASGPWADVQVAANKAVNHTADLVQNIPGLGNYTSSLANSITGPIAEQYSKPYQDALGKVQTNKLGVSGELAKVFKGNGASSDREIKDWESNFSEYSGDTKMLSSAQEGMKMMMGQLDPLADKMNQERRKNPGDPGYITGRDLLDPAHREAYDRIMSIDPLKGSADVKRAFGQSGMAADAVPAKAYAGAPETAVPPARPTGTTDEQLLRAAADQARQRPDLTDKINERLQTWGIRQRIAPPVPATAGTGG